MKKVDWWLVTAIVILIGLIIFCISCVGAFLRMIDPNFVLFGWLVMFAGFFIFIVKIMNKDFEYEEVDV